jgi:hypothetical protein
MEKIRNSRPNNPVSIDEIKKKSFFLQKKPKKIKVK